MIHNAFVDKNITLFLKVNQLLIYFKPLVLLLLKWNLNEAVDSPWWVKSKEKGRNPNLEQSESIRAPLQCHRYLEILTCVPTGSVSSSFEESADCGSPHMVPSALLHHQPPPEGQSPGEGKANSLCFIWRWKLANSFLPSEKSFVLSPGVSALCFC